MSCIKFKCGHTAHLHCLYREWKTSGSNYTKGYCAACTTSYHPDDDESKNKDHYFGNLRFAIKPKETSYTNMDHWSPYETIPCYAIIEE